MLKPSTVQFHLNSAWFSGFTDAEGGFYASLSQNKRFATGFRERYKFYIPQKGEQQFLEKINEVLQFESIAKMSSQRREQELNKQKRSDLMCKKITRVREIAQNTYRLEITQIANLEALIDYFDKYALLTKKKLMYVRWKRVILRRDQLKVIALVSKKGLRRYKNLYASVGKIRPVQRLLCLP